MLKGRGKEWKRDVERAKEETEKGCWRVEARKIMKGGCQGGSEREQKKININQAYKERQQSAVRESLEGPCSRVSGSRI